MVYPACQLRKKMTNFSLDPCRLRLVVWHSDLVQLPFGPLHLPASLASSAHLPDPSFQSASSENSLHILSVNRETTVHEITHLYGPASSLS